MRPGSTTAAPVSRAKQPKVETRLWNETHQPPSISTGVDDILFATRRISTTIDFGLC